MEATQKQIELIDRLISDLRDTRAGEIINMLTGPNAGELFRCGNYRTDRRHASMCINLLSLKGSL